MFYTQSTVVVISGRCVKQTASMAIRSKLQQQLRCVQHSVLTVHKEQRCLCTGYSTDYSDTTSNHRIHTHTHTALICFASAGAVRRPIWLHNFAVKRKIALNDSFLRALVLSDLVTTRGRQSQRRHSTDTCKMGFRLRLRLCRKPGSTTKSYSPPSSSRQSPPN